MQHHRWFHLVFSLSIFVTPIFNNEKPGFHHVYCIYLSSLSVCKQAHVSAAFPYCHMSVSILSYHSTLESHECPPFSSTYSPTAPTVDAYFLQPQLMDFGLNCLRRKERERKGKRKKGGEMGKKGRRVKGGKGKIEKGRRKKKRKLNFIVSLQPNDFLSHRTLLREGI